MKKSECKIDMEKALLEAVYHMAIESLSPDQFENLENIIEVLYENRNLGKCSLTDYKI